MVIGSWILTVLAYAVLAAEIVIGVVVLPNSIVSTILEGVALFVVLGTIAYFLLHKYREKDKANKRKQTFLYCLTLLPAGIALIIIRIVGFIIKTVKKCMGIISDSTSSNQTPANSDNSIVIHTPYERRLRLVDKYQTDYENGKYEAKNPYYSQHYNRYKDDIGNYWRSYDGGKHFISEAEMAKNGWASW